MRPFFYIQLLGLLTLTTAHAIIGGHDTSFTEHPWHVTLQFKKGVCGGVIIHPRAVLTAAHCLTEYGQVYAVQGGGSGYWEELRILGRPAKLIVHENWAGSAGALSTHDLGLIITDTELKLGQDVGSIALAQNDYQVSFETSVVSTTGFGTTESENQSSWLRTVDLPMVPYFSEASYWLPLLANDENLYEQSFRPYGRGLFVTYDLQYLRGACNGDSGGPLVFYNPQSRRKELLGVSALVKGDCGEITGFTSVPFYYEWIKETLSKEGISL